MADAAGVSMTADEFLAYYNQRGRTLSGNTAERALEHLAAVIRERDAANARIASMPRCNICGGDVVFNGGEPVEGMWGHRK